MVRGSTGEAAERMKFEEMLTNTGSAFSVANNLFYPSAGTQYYISLSAGVRADKQLELRVRNRTTIFFRLERGHTGHVGADTLSVDTIMSGPSKEGVYIEDRTGTYSDAHFQTSFNAFSLTGNRLVDQESIVKQEVAQTSGTGALLTRELSAKAGTYFMTLIFHADTTRPVDIDLEVCGQTFKAFRQFTLHNGMDAFLVSTLVKCSGTGTGNVARVVANVGMPLIASYQTPTALYGFRSTADVVVAPATAWHFRFRSPAAPRVISGTDVAAADYILKESTGSLLGGSSANQTVRILHRGDYFMHLSVTAPDRQRVDVQVNWYSSGVLQRQRFGILRASTQHEGMDTISRSIILPLKVGDELQLVVNSPLPSLAPAGAGNRFLGFLVTAPMP